MKKLLPVLYLLTLLIVYYYRDPLWTFIHNDPSPLLMTGICTVLAIFPIIPYKLIIAAMGYTYGPWLGAMITWSATTFASIAIYLLVRYAFRTQGRHYLRKWKHLDAFTSLIEQHPTVAMILARIIPILPQMGVNIYAGVASISLWSFFIGTTLGKIPAIALFAYLGGNKLDNPIYSLAAVLAYCALLFSLLYIYRKKTPQKLKDS